MDAPPHALSSDAVATLDLSAEEDLADAVASDDEMADMTASISGSSSIIRSSDVHDAGSGAGCQGAAIWLGGQQTASLAFQVGCHTARRCMDARRKGRGDLTALSTLQLKTVCKGLGIAYSGPSKNKLVLRDAIVDKNTVRGPR